MSRRSRLLVPPLLTLLCLTLLLLVRPAPAHAQGGGLATGTAPAPLSGAGTVEFVSQSVDAALNRTEDGLYWADVEGSVRLNNTDRFRYATVTLGWPGWPGGDLRFDPNDLPGFAPTRGGARLGSELRTYPTTWAGETRDSNWLVTQTSIAPNTRDRLTVAWRQPLGPGPLLTYSFGLLPAGSWAGVVGSARVTLNLPTFASEEIILHAEPMSYTFTGNKIEWFVVEEEPVTNPTVTLIAPHMWQAIEGARAALATEPLTASLRLADLYEELAAAGATIYSAEAEATLEAARRAAPDNPAPLSRLAALYRARAERDGENLAAREQAALAAEAALAAGATDDALRAALVGDLQQLAAAWAESDPALALTFLERAEAAGGDPATLAPQRRALAESLALEALARDDLQAALGLAAQHGLETEIAPFPWLTRATMHITNEPNRRTLTLSATGEEAKLTERLGGLANLLTTSGFAATWDAEAGTFSLHFTGDEAAWSQGARVVAPAIADEPEWDLLRAALLSATLEYRVVSDAFRQRYGYREALTVEGRAAERAATLLQEAETHETEWARQLTRAAAARWQALADSQSVRVTTRFAVAGGSAQREWTLAPPTSETLEWRGESARRDRWLLLGGGGLLGLLALLALIWLPAPRRRR